MMRGRLSALRALPVLLLAAVTLSSALPGDADAQSKRRKKSCLECHEQFKERLDVSFKHKPVEEGCESCHKRHGFTQKLVLTKAPPDLCVDCHEGVGAEIANANVHAALSEGGCTVCHDPHGSDVEGLLRLPAEGSSICLNCHDNLSRAFYEGDNHKPFGDGDCAACHQPHASDFPSLLVDREENVCATCHDDVTGKHKMPGWTDFPCGSCHDPHTANKDTPLASFAHDPFAEGDCESCHNVADGEVDMGADFPAADLCADCHDGVASAVAGAESHFGADALRDGGTETCLECHDPHASGLPSMLTAVESEMCRDCHEGLPAVAGFKGVMHRPFREGDCSGCHDPHGGGGSIHAARPGNDLCTSCHENRTATAVAAAGGTVHEAMELSECVDCHSGHVSDGFALLQRPFGETCLECHDKERHTETHPPYLTGSCESCHRNHSTNPNLLPADANLVCGRCHESQLYALQAEHQHPAATEDNCLACHAAHGSEDRGLLVQAQGSLCADCHDSGDLVLTVAGSGGGETAEMHAPVAAGNCSGCHNPHGSKLAVLLERENENLCFGCHTQEKIDFLTEDAHQPVAEGKCDVCHTPHGSTQANLTTDAEPALCTQCHDVVEEGLADVHQGFDVSASRCTSCHTPHSSRMANLLNPFVHEPFADGDCGACHEGTGGGGAIAVATANVCSDCHEQGESWAHADGVDCIGCHQPHASRFEKLIADPSGTCTECHGDVLAAAGSDDAVLHRPIEDGSCLECHKVHDSRKPGYLAVAQGELCASCHETMAARADDQTRHEPFGAGECSECHATHVATQPHLLNEAPGELCSTCHELDTATMKQRHDDIPLTGRGCTSCHDPHSTVAANSALILPVRHDPYAEKECDVCHGADGTPATSLTVCADCHDSSDDFATVHAGGRPAAEASSVGVCTDCHSPHAGHDHLLRRNGQAETCLQCHDRAEYTRPTVHGALEEGCDACHNVHESNFDELRGAGSDGLCIGCHPESAEHAHPIGPEYKDPRTGDVMTCLACHEPHSSDFDRLTTFDHARDLCVQCHASGSQNVHQ